MSWHISDARREAFQHRLLDWYRIGRRRFSWRNGKRSAYETLVAEMLLRKTDAAKVAAIFEGLIASYPRVKALAAADEAALREQIRLLGIFDRARLLRLTAQQILDRHAGRVPSTLSELLALPGVGRYTANAVLCFAYRRDAPLLDSNIIRIFERVFTVRSSKARPHEDVALWSFAEQLVPPGRATTYNRALLDFAATVCTAAKPRCASCPILFLCDYGQKHQTVAQVPAPPTKPENSSSKP